MKTFRDARINARTVVLDAPHHDDSGPPLRVVPGAGRLCHTASCRNVVSDDWDESGRYCAKCAVERDLYDREARRERCFPQDPF